MGLVSRLKGVFGEGPKKGVEQIRQLLERYVPEIAQGVVQIKAIARDDYWTKVAVEAMDPKVDPVRVCAGDEAGSRIRRVVDDLGGPRVARIDIIRWRDPLPEMIANALGPAQIAEVLLNPWLGRAVVVVLQEQLSKAIGDADGRNVRLASQLVGWNIELVTPEELDEVVERAKNWFRQIPGVTVEVVESFVKAGLLSYDDLKNLRPAQLAELAGITVDRAKAMIRFAAESGERLEE